MDAYLAYRGRCCDRDSNKGPKEHMLLVIIKAVKDGRNGCWTLGVPSSFFSFFLQEQAIYLALDPIVPVFQVALLHGVGMMLSETFKNFSGRD